MANVTSPSAIITKVCEAIRTLPKAAPTVTNSVWLTPASAPDEVAAGINSPKPNNIVVWYGPIPPFDGMPIEMLVSTKQTSTTSNPWLSNRARVNGKAWKATSSCRK